MTTKKDLGLLQRLAGPTPDFFKKVITIALILATIGGSLMGVNEQMPGALPDWLVMVAGWFVVGGIVATAVSGVTVDKKKLEEQNKKG